MFTNREYHPAFNRRMTLYLRDDPCPHIRCLTPHVTVYTGLWQYRWTPHVTVHTGLWQYCWTPHVTVHTRLWQYHWTPCVTTYWTVTVPLDTTCDCTYRTVTVPLDTTCDCTFQAVTEPLDTTCDCTYRTVAVPNNEINIFILHYTKCYFWDKARLVFGGIPIKYVNVVWSLLLALSFIG